MKEVATKRSIAREFARLERACHACRRLFKYTELMGRTKNSGVGGQNVMMKKLWSKPDTDISGVDVGTTASQQDQVSDLIVLNDEELDAVAGGRSYLVFFDWDKATRAGGTPVARNIGLDPDAVTRK